MAAWPRMAVWAWPSLKRWPLYDCAVTCSPGAGVEPAARVFSSHVGTYTTEGIPLHQGLVTAGSIPQQLDVVKPESIEGFLTYARRCDNLLVQALSPLPELSAPMWAHAPQRACHSIEAWSRQGLLSGSAVS